MKIQVVSDLHIEFAGFTLPETDADVIILAGDIGVGLGGLEWIVEQSIDKPIIYVPGNHEFYQHDICLIDELCDRSPSNVYVLNDSMVEIQGVRFLGCILWTDFELFGLTDKYFSVQQAKKNMSDFTVIKNGMKTFHPDDSIQLHNQSVGWLKCMLSESFAGNTVVVTHHAPSTASVHPRYASNLLTPAFASNLEDMMGADRAKLWIHGHMHNPSDYEINGTHILCNPRGYAHYETTHDFNPGLVVNI